jgi:hypothetical protein
MESNRCPNQNTILLPAGTYTLTIPLSSDGRAGSDLDIIRSVFIRGDGAGTTIIDGNRRNVSVLQIGDVSGLLRPIVNISGITIRNGSSNGYGGAIALAENTSLTLINSIIENNSAYSGGGGIYNSGSLYLTSCTVRNNDGGPRGGGIAHASTGYMNISRSTLNNNQATQGGGVLSNGRMEITNSTVSGNRSGRGGAGLLTAGPEALLYVSSCTITGNEANARGLAAVSGAGIGGGILNGSTRQVYLWNSIIAGNTDNRSFSTTAPDISGDVRSEDYNLIGNGQGATITRFSGPLIDLVGTISSPIDPRLGPLANNGGPTQTHALLFNSPAIDAARSSAPGSGLFACPETDQRGFARNADGNGDGKSVCDMGAFEKQPSNARIEIVSQHE